MSQTPRSTRPYPSNPAAYFGERIRNEYDHPPCQNCSNENFDGKFRNAYLLIEWFRSQTEQRAMIETWLRHDNTVRLT
ncbi:integrase core domain-containing protein [Desulfomicrobium apsheronum]|uniref:integrase core domain-containing protein n=1 Tax=Desulfomicrobium apsheronum TaxID=52560 RepID=UPI003CCC2DC3